jgi:hypothetical protein
VWVVTVLVAAYFGYLLLKLTRGMRQVEAHLPQGIVGRLRAHPETVIDFEAAHGPT